MHTDIPDQQPDPRGVIAEHPLGTPHTVISQPAQTMSTALVSDPHVRVARMTESHQAAARVAGGIQFRARRDGGLLTAEIGDGIGGMASAGLS